MFTNITGVKRKGIKAGSTQGPMRTVTTVITGEPVKQKPKPKKLRGVGQAGAVNLKGFGQTVGGASLTNAINYKNVQELDKKYNRGGKVCK